MRQHRPRCARIGGGRERVRPAFVVGGVELPAETVRQSSSRGCPRGSTLTPDHLDRHGDLETYAAMKDRLFVRQDESDWAVRNADDPAVASRRFSHGAPLEFSVSHAVPEGAYRRGRHVVNGVARRTRAPHAALRVRLQARTTSRTPSRRSPPRSRCRSPLPDTLRSANTAVSRALAGAGRRSAGAVRERFQGHEHRLPEVALQSYPAEDRSSRVAATRAVTFAAAGLARPAVRKQLVPDR